MLITGVLEKLIAVLLLHVRVLVTVCKRGLSQSSFTRVERMRHLISCVKAHFHAWANSWILPGFSVCVCVTAAPSSPLCQLRSEGLVLIHILLFYSLFHSQGGNQTADRRGKPHDSHGALARFVLILNALSFILSFNGYSEPCMMSLT